MRYYKLNNLYYSYNDLHNTYGYTYTPTQEIGYLTVLPWGGSTQVIEGFRVNTNVYSESNYFVINETGWVGLNNLAWDKGYFPEDVENTVLSRNGETSNVVFLQFEDEPRYLIEKDLSAGWITEQEYTERGWGKGTGIILIDKIQDEETFIASLPEVEFLTKDEHIPDIDKSLLELPIVPQIEFITKDVHIPSINKTLLEIPVTTSIDFIVKDKHIPDINKTLLEIPVPTSIELVKKSNLPDVVLFLSSSEYGFSNTYNSLTNTVDVNGNSILFADIDNTIPIQVFSYNTSSNYTYTETQNRQSSYIVNNSSIAAWKAAGPYYGNYRVYYASYCDDQNAELITLYKTPSYVRVPAYRLGSSYFILDGTHTSWVDDITVEGYTETPSQETCYVSGGTGPTLVNGQINYYSGTRVYNNSGSIYRYNATKTYSVDSIYNKNGDLITGRTGTVHNDGTYITISVSGNTYLDAATVKLNITNLLPTVELFSVDGYKDYVYINNHGNAVALQPNSTGDFYIIPISGGTGERTGYGSSKIYALSYWEYNEGELYNRVGIDVISNSGWLGWRSSSNCGFLRGKLYSCDSTSASVVTVYDSSNREYNAFKFTLSGTDYYYVLDEVQTAWSNDLSSIGYSLTPVVVLPTVTLDNWVLPDTATGTTTIQGGSTAGAGEAGAYPREKVAFDNSCVYATTFWRHANNTFAGRIEIAPVNDSGYIGLYNTTNQALEVYWVNYAICSDSTVTVVTVYDSSNTAYNAFKFTASGTDYYYVLDGTQTEWTDDLESIGYRLDMEFLLGFKWDNDLTSLEAVNDLSNDYYWARVISQNDKDILTSMGIWYSNISNTKYGGLVYDSRYTYSFVAIYSDMGETIAPQHDPDKCLIRSYAAAQVLGLYYDGTSSESVMTWKCRITKNA